MKKTAARITCAIAALLLLLLLTACETELIGTWKSVTDPDRTAVSFKASGKVIMDSGDFEVEGTYSVKENVITMILTDPEGDQYQLVAKYAISGKKLFLENENGQVEAFTK